MTLIIIFLENDFSITINDFNNGITIIIINWMDPINSYEKDFSSVYSHIHVYSISSIADKIHL